jgi:hypothetical protein
MGNCCTSAAKPDTKINGTLSQFSDETHNEFSRAGLIDIETQAA